MKATGIVRRIDDLGRIVIPIEIRRDMNIRDGDPLEIFVDKHGEVILKKYSAIAELGDFGRAIVNSLHETTGHLAFLTDRDEVVAVAGAEEKEFKGKGLGDPILQAMEHREALSYDSQNHHSGALLGGEGQGKCEFVSEAIAPIIVSGDPVGAVILASRQAGAALGELEVKLTQTAAGFLARHMEE